MLTGLKCRAYPTPEQAAILSRTFGCVRLVWNLTLAWRSSRWHDQKERIDFSDASAYLTTLKKNPDSAFLREVSSVPLQQVLRTQQTAFANFFAKRARYPRFKTRSGRQSAEYTRSGFRWREGNLWLAKMDMPLKIVWSWPGIDPSTVDPSTVTVSRDPDGRWYVSLRVDIATPHPMPTTGTAIGVDMGVIDLAVCSDGVRYSNPKALAHKARNLARYQRRLARAQRGSRNRAKARAKVARAHRKVRAARRDHLHRVSADLIRRHDHIVIEDLNTSGMLKNRRAARAISDCGWGELRRQLSYKAAIYGRKLTIIDRWQPTTKQCSHCGHMLGHLALSTRHWTCPSCGSLHDRDLNAAKNILAAGLAVTACGADVRHARSPGVQSAKKQEVQPVTVELSEAGPGE